MVDINNSNKIISSGITTIFYLGITEIAVGIACLIAGTLSGRYVEGAWDGLSMFCCGVLAISLRHNFDRLVLANAATPILATVIVTVNTVMVRTLFLNGNKPEKVCDVMLAVFGFIGDFTLFIHSVYGIAMFKTMLMMETGRMEEDISKSPAGGDVSNKTNTDDVDNYPVIIEEEEENPPDYQMVFNDTSKLFSYANVRFIPGAIGSNISDERD